jgi:hypothetical protein
MKKCVACTADSQCAAKLGANPGVCMAHQNGRCATDAETFYVSNQAACANTGANGGTVAVPFCTLDPAATAVSSDRSVVVVRGVVTSTGKSWAAQGLEVSIVGQGSATVGSVTDTALVIGIGGRLYARDLTVTSVANVGIFAGAGSTLKLDRVVVSNSAKGGIQLNGASFDISNTTVSGNGPGSDGALFWGGIYVQFPPTGGPNRLNLVTVTNNKSAGISCTGPITGIGVFATGNAGDVSGTCGFLSCPVAGPACGAQP